jgi:NitT/TauT family transport system substrate-binding protein
MHRASGDGLTRRSLLAASAGLALGGARMPLALAQAGRSLKVNVAGFSLGIHIPAISALREGIAAVPGYAPCEVIRIDKLPMITQSVLGGSSEIADGDVVTTLKAAEAGADIKIIGLAFNSTSLIFVANGKRVKKLEDLQEPGRVVAVNSIGDFTHVMLIGPLLKRGVDLSKITITEIGGSGNRMRALIAGKVDAVPIHVDQAASVQKEGDFPILLRPWAEYKAWFGEVFFTTGAWLQKPENRKAAVDLMRATLVAFRKADTDFAWYAGQYRKHATVKDAAKEGDDTIRSAWSTLKDEVKAWPPSMDTLTPENFQELMPVYKAAGALNGSLDMRKVVDRSILEEALKGL